MDQEEKVEQMNEAEETKDTVQPKGNEEEKVEQSEEQKKKQTEEKKQGKPVQKKPRKTIKALEMELKVKDEIIDEASAKYKDANDKYQRLMAEFENMRKRTEKESKQMYAVGAKEALEKLLPVIDNFERAIKAVPEESQEDSFVQGINAIYKQTLTYLESVGVTPMNAEGTEFNPDLHNAVMHIEDEAYGDNVVVEELQKGYMYKDTVLRHSMVKVAN